MRIFLVEEKDGVDFMLAVHEQIVPDGDCGAVDLCLLLRTDVSIIYLVYGLSQNFKQQL